MRQLEPVVGAYFALKFSIKAYATIGQLPAGNISWFLNTEPRLNHKTRSHHVELTNRFLAKLRCKLDAVTVSGGCAGALAGIAHLATPTRHL